MGSGVYGGEESDVVYAVQKTGDGGYILAGETHSADGATAFAKRLLDMLKTDAELVVVEWERSFGNSETVAGLRNGRNFRRSSQAVRQTRDGGYILAGSSTGSSGHGRLAGANRPRWEAAVEPQPRRSHPLSSLHRRGGLRRCVQTSDGGFAVAGSANVGQSEEAMPLLIKI